MNTLADKTQENKSQTAAAETSQMQSGDESTFQFVDNRPEAVAQRKLQEMANSSPQAKQAAKLQGMANHSSQVRQLMTVQKMDIDESKEVEQPQLPRYLYHATAFGNAVSIARNGLQARSVGGSEVPYLCMSGELSGATTLERRASDIIFRVSSDKLDRKIWSKSGAGKSEWRSTSGVNKGKLEYRRFLGTKEQLQWKSAADLV